jgi:hypothetical protein
MSSYLTTGGAPIYAKNNTVEVEYGNIKILVYFLVLLYYVRFYPKFCGGF